MTETTTCYCAKMLRFCAETHSYKLGIYGSEEAREEARRGEVNLVLADYFTEDEARRDEFQVPYSTVEVEPGLPFPSWLDEDEYEGLTSEETARTLGCARTYVAKEDRGF